MARVQATERPARPAEDQEAAKRCLVAIIEDDAEFRTMLRELLEEEQYRVVALANGAEALEALRGDALPNVILLDVSMPVMVGFDFLRFRNEDPQLAAVPVVLVTTAKPHQAADRRMKQLRPQADRHRRDFVCDQALLRLTVRLGKR